MSRSGRTGMRYITPIDSTGASPAEKGRGVYTLTAGTTYHYVLGGDEAPFLSVQLIGKTLAALVTSATIRDSNTHPSEVTDQDLTAGNWPPETPTSAFVAVEGTGWAVTATPGVVGAAGTGVGGALWHIAESGAFRTKLTVVVGATGGDFMVAGHGKR